MEETTMGNHRIGASVSTLRDPTPSPEDVRLTAEAGRAGELLGIDVLDHVVIGRPGYASLRERGLYTPPGNRELQQPPDSQTGPSSHAPTTGGAAHA